eukprot:105726_1
MSSLRSPKYLNQINEKSKMEVFGYIRQIKTTLCVDNIPMTIAYLCLAYKSHGEYFDSKLSASMHDGIEIAKDQLTITNILDRCEECGNDEFEDCYECSEADRYDPLAYGSQVVPSDENRIAEWKIQIDNETILKRRYWRNGIGFCISYCDETEIDESWCWLFHFESCTGGISYLPSRYKFNIEFGAQIMNKVSTGDYVTMILDTKQKMFFAKKNDGEIKCLMKNLPAARHVKYRLQIRLSDKGDKVSIIDFLLK